MRKFLLLLFIFYLVNLVIADEKHSSELERDVKNFEYKKDDFTYLISGGRRLPATLGYVKYMVSIRSRRPQKYFGDNHFCAGTIIGPKVILTAAHCVMDKRKVTTRPRRLLVVAGSPNRLRIENTTRQISVESVIAHHNYVTHNIDDIALIFLQRDLPVTGEQIQVMPLPKKPPPFGINCTAIGWGRMYYNGPLAAAAVHVEVYLLTREECKTIAPQLNLKGALCAGDHVLYNEDPCRGDSGGPLICNGELTGIISWTIGCGNKELPSLYTEVYSHLDWIRSNKAGRLVKASCLAISLVIINISYNLMN